MCCKGFEKNIRIRSHRSRKYNSGSGSGFFLLVQVQTVQAQMCRMKSGLAACCRFQFQDLLRSVQKFSFVFGCKEEQPNKKGLNTRCALRAVIVSFRENALK